MSNWMGCKKILCIRPDNMGDLIMSAPAIRALKESFGCTITLLTSSMAAGIVPSLPEIDDVILFDAPWVKTLEQPENNFYEVIERIKEKQFDAAVILTVFSQNPLPSAMIAYLAGVPKRLAYCRENPYALLTDWLADKEPYSFVQHQVERDLSLVASVGAYTQKKKLALRLRRNVWPDVFRKMDRLGFDWQKPWLVMHTGVSEPKREYPYQLWVETGRQIINDLNYQLLLTGNQNEREKIESLKNNIGSHAFNTAGLLSLEEFITLIGRSPIVLSVNTSTIHIAAAMDTPVVVLYALSNPQHSPWMATGKLLLFDIPKDLRSKNEVLQYMHRCLYPKNISTPIPADIVQSIRDVLIGEEDCFIPALIPLQTAEQVF